MGLVKERAKILREFDQYVRTNVTSEGLFQTWLEQGIPDGADDALLLEFARDDEIWLDIVECFAQIVARVS